MLALCLMLLPSYYAQNYAGIIDSSLNCKLSRHENTSGYYSVGAYFLARVMVDFVILRFLPTIVLAAISYWMVGMCVCSLVMYLKYILLMCYFR